ncbi:protein wntless-like isoform X2 [Varroa jacobsoni]|uniref:Protein wntless n=1 Tax=Varroa destructor TaxID=109461 RepID=A0A7M7JCU2_VARDE|nr:protein wntless-like isoform X2 [Varroa destructor]XP_022697098.1 protein wntless-like isoform X2 [Varroa jacobsoni]
MAGGSGSILENLSGKKLAVIVSIVLVVQGLCFLLGGVIAPAPSNADQVLGSICAQENPTVPGDFSWPWAFPRGSKRRPVNCNLIENLAYIHTKDLNITANHLVFSFQLPLPKENKDLDYSRWQQNLIGVLHMDILHDPNNPLKQDPVVTMDIKMGYRNKHESPDTWHLLANSTETRTLKCDINSTHHHIDQLHYGGYNCDVMSLFELGSLHHDYYLINVKFPLNEDQTINTHIGQLNDVWLVVIHQNGGFTQVFLSLKTVFLPIILATMMWYWKRIRIMDRPPHLLECCILALSVAMTAINLPIEFLTLSFNMPYMMLICDIRQGIFYAMLFSFWLIFCGEHLMDDVERNRLSAYWQQLLFVFTGCLCMLVFDICERGVHLTNPFYSIWSTQLGHDLATGFLALTLVCAISYFCYLCRLLYRVRCNISSKRSALPGMSQTRRLFYEGIIYRFKFLLLATLVTAALTVVAHFVSQWSEGQWKFDEEISLEFTSAFFTGVLGCWNGYVFMLLVLYAPSHKYKNQSQGTDLNNLTDENQDSIEFSRLTNSEGCAEVPEASGVAALAEFAKKIAVD